MAASPLGNLNAAERQYIDRALGRLFSLMSRPTQPGDVEQYETIRGAVMSLVGEDGAPAPLMRRPLPGWDFGHGASGCIE